MEGSHWAGDLQAVPEPPGAGTRAELLPPPTPPPAPRARQVTLTRTRLNRSSSSPAAGIGCLGAAGCLGDGAAGPAGCSALPAALPMVVPTQPARRLQPRKSSFPGGGGRGSRPGGRGERPAAAAGARRRGSSAQRRAGAGARRPIAAAPSEEQGSELRGGGRKSGCRPPGPEGWAGGRKLRRGLPPRRVSNFCYRSRCAQTAFRRRRYAPGPGGAGWREGAGAGCRPGVCRSHGAAGRGPPTRFTCRRGGGRRRFTCRSRRRPRRG